MSLGFLGNWDEKNGRELAEKNVQELLPWRLLIQYYIMRCLLCTYQVRVHIWKTTMAAVYPSRLSNMIYNSTVLTSCLAEYCWPVLIKQTYRRLEPTISTSYMLESTVYKVLGESQAEFNQIEQYFLTKISSE